MGRTLVRNETQGRGEETKFWDESDPRVLYDAVADACWIYRYRDLRENLQRLGWKKARRRVLAHGSLSNEWVGRGRGEVRLRRRGLELRSRGGVRRLGWKELQDFVRAERY